MAKNFWRDIVSNRVREFFRARRWLLYALVITLSLLLLIGLPGYLTGRPEFFKRYPGTEKYYASWATSTHAHIACWRCHVRPERTTQALHRVRMVGEFYINLIFWFKTPKVWGKPPIEACKSCHYLGRIISPSGDLKISHGAHIEVLKIPCIRCHKAVVHYKRKSPRMTTCLVCHDNKRASEKCTTCHKRKSIPVSHRALDWLIVHSQKQQELKCPDCHAFVPNFCRTCHIKRPRSHHQRWRTFHRIKVVTRRNCEACHQGPFCTRCHGEIPQFNISKAPKFVE